MPILEVFRQYPRERQVRPPPHISFRRRRRLAFVFIFLVDTGNWPLTVPAVVGGLLFHGAMYGRQAAFLSELFGTRVRYSGYPSATNWPRSSPVGWRR